MLTDREQEETRRLLAEMWHGLPSDLRLPTQYLGRHNTGCSATIGIMPSCDFSCKCCYLGEESADAIPLPVEEIKAQMRLIRSRLGPAGNLQLSDGEVTLRDPGELIELIAYAREIGLVPMLMTHGETFRRTPGLLERFMTVGGLTEVGFHVDATMRGRHDSYDQAESESDLQGLREEFAGMIREARQRTGLRLEAASTITVTRSTLDDVPGVVRWFLRNADAFKMVSFQPVSAVGRTDSALEGVSSNELWERIADGAGDPGLCRGEGRFGHPDCTRFVQGLVANRKGSARLVPFFRNDHPDEMAFLNDLLNRLGGISFRLDDRARAIRRGIRTLLRHGTFVAARLIPYLLHLAFRGGGLHRRYLTIVSHHFMDANEMKTRSGRERLAACAFRVPVNGGFEPMCAVNALGMRETLLRSESRDRSP